jgi:predicted nucleic acid-binding protein
MIFVDTGAWYALATASDPDHAAARTFIASNSETLVATDYVVDELLTLFGVRKEKAKGIEWRRDVLDRGGVNLIRIIEDDFSSALEIYEQFLDKAWSFTECTSYAVMKRLAIEKAFSFDRHFYQFGTVTVVPSPE